MPDDLSLGELGRQLERMHADIREDIRELGLRLDGKVGSDVFKLEQAAQDDKTTAVAQRVASIEEARKEEGRQRANDRKLLLTALILPIVVVLVGLGAQVVLKVTGVL